MQHPLMKTKGNSQKRNSGLHCRAHSCSTTRLWGSILGTSKAVFLAVRCPPPTTKNTLPLHLFRPILSTATVGAACGHCYRHVCPVADGYPYVALIQTHSHRQRSGERPSPMTSLSLFQDTGPLLVVQVQGKLKTFPYPCLINRRGSPTESLLCSPHWPASATGPQPGQPSTDQEGYVLPKTSNAV